MKTLEKLLSKEEVSGLLGISIATLYGWIHAKRIPFVKIGRLVKFDRNEINAWIEERKVKTQD